MKRKKFREARGGHIGPNGKREEAVMGEVKDEEEILCDIPGGTCFVKGTLVASERGLRAIETLKKDDKVWSRDEATGQTELKRVKQTFEKQAPATLILTFSNGETIETTREHPFYVESRGFVKAGELGIGTSIVTRAGPSIRVALTEVGKAQTVYNFEVEDFHSYFVGKSQAWVHNADYAPGMPPMGNPQLANLIRNVANEPLTAAQKVQKLKDEAAKIVGTVFEHKPYPGMQPAGDVFIGQVPAGGGQPPLLYIAPDGKVWRGGSNALTTFPPGQEFLDMTKLICLSQ